LRVLFVALLCVSAHAGEYDGKYKSDPRLAKVRAELPARLAAARKRIPYEGALRVEFRDLGQKGAGVLARTLRGEEGFVIVLYTEPLLLRIHELEATLAHELVHCLQKKRWGTRGEMRYPAWVREGMAVYLAGQFEERARALAAYAGREGAPADAVTRIVNGLDGRHGLHDYAEDGAAFVGVEQRHGRQNARAFVEALLDGASAASAARSVLGEKWDVFERESAEFARRRLAPLVTKGRAAMLRLRRLVAERSYEKARGVPACDGVYAQDSAYPAAQALAGVGREREALTVLRQRLLDRPLRSATVLDRALVLELELLRKLGKEKQLTAAAADAKLDLTPYPRSHAEVLKQIGSD